MHSFRDVPHKLERNEFEQQFFEQFEVGLNVKFEK